MTFDPDQIALKHSVRRYLSKQVSPRIADCERDHGISLELLAGLKQFGYVGGLLSEQDGGFALDSVTWAMLVEEAGYCWGSLRTIVNITNVFLRIVADQGTPQQKSHFIGPVLSSAKHVCVALSEPDVGSDMSSVRFRADDKGDHWLLSGSKMWITNGVHADYVLLIARTFSSGCDGKLSLFLVDKAQSPFEARHIEKMVLRASGTSQLDFRDVQVPKTALLGEEGGALTVMLKGLDFGRLNIAAGAVGAAQAAFDLSVEYAKTRQQFGKPIASFQLVQKRVVEMLVRVESARALTYRAAEALHTGIPARVICSLAKLYAAEAAHEVAKMALEMHGGLGYAAEYPIERIFRDTAGGLIPEGTADIQALIVGREVLGVSAIR